MKYITSWIKANYWLVIFCIGYIVFAGFLAKRIGIPWDESDVYHRGRVLADYLSQKTSYGVYSSDTWGLLYDHLYSMILNILNFKQTYGGFHFLNLVFALAAYIASYLIVYGETRKQSSAIWAVMLLFITTRFSGEAAINPKDLPMAVMYIVSLYAILKTDKWSLGRRTAVLGAVIGITSCMRIMALNLILVLALFDIFTNKFTKQSWYKLGFSYLLIIIMTLIILYVTWPYFANDFPSHIINILQSSKSFAWDGLVLYAGSRIPATKLPLSYIPVWIAITTPLVVFYLITHGLIRIKQLITQRPYLLMVIAILINMAMYFVLKPVVYDGMRHFMYLLPIITTMAALSIDQMKRLPRMISWILMVPPVLAIMSLYPYQYIYFNELVGGLRGAAPRFETDYMGISHKDATIWLRDQLNDQKKPVKVATCGQTISSTHYFAPNMTWTPNIHEADYFVCYTRFNEHMAVPDDKTIYSVKRAQVDLAYVKKLH